MRQLLQKNLAALHAALEPVAAAVSTSAPGKRPTAASVHKEMGAIHSLLEEASEEPSLYTHAHCPHASYAVLLDHLRACWASALPLLASLDKLAASASHIGDPGRDVRADLCEAAAPLLRPACDVSADYQISARRGWVTVGAIRSTGLTAALGIARHVARVCEESALEMTPAGCAALPRARDAAAVRTTPLPPLAELYASFAARGDGSVVLGADEMGFGAHAVTHPLTREGFARQAALLSRP